MIGAKTTLRGTVKVNNDGVGLTPSIGQLLFKGFAASCCVLAIHSRGTALVIANPLPLSFRS
jgi:hypothetical protein